MRRRAPNPKREAGLGRGEPSARGYLLLGYSILRVQTIAVTAPPRPGTVGAGSRIGCLVFMLVVCSESLPHAEAAILPSLQVVCVYIPRPLQPCMHWLSV